MKSNDSRHIFSLAATFARVVNFSAFRALKKYSKSFWLVFFLIEKHIHKTFTALNSSVKKMLNTFRILWKLWKDKSIETDHFSYKI